MQMEELKCDTKSRYRCTVQLHIKVSDIRSVGVGYSPPIETHNLSGNHRQTVNNSSITVHFLAVQEKGLSLSMAKKSAYQQACESAFSRLHLVCLSTGKVWCEDIGRHTDTDIEENLVTVNQVDMDESEEEPDDLIDGKKLEELLNELQRER
jgi:hypothetical protein